MKALSLFANIGVAEAYLKDVGIEVAVANELIPERAALYSKIYPNTDMICGDITKKEVKDQIISKSKRAKVQIIMATPPCQGMSLLGQRNSEDVRNLLICQVIDMVKEISPNYVFIENVPSLYRTKIVFNGNEILIPDLIETQLSDLYEINKYVINTKDYGVPQSRERAILLLTKKGMQNIWILPEKDEKEVSIKDVIGDLPPLDPYVSDVTEEERKEMFPYYEDRRKRALYISPWHTPPKHIKRHVLIMQHTPTGCSAYDNKVFYPVRKDGKRVTGYHTSYSRQKWNMPAYTVTMNNGYISSQSNVHPGHFDGKDQAGNIIYSDARVLTLYEIMLIMSLPKDWPIPKDTSETFLRRIIGEGIPPVFVKKVFAAI